MTAAIKRMLADREQATETHELALRRELNRRIVEAAKLKFTSSFARQQRFYRSRYSSVLPALPIETLAACEAAELASDPGWDAERAWNFSETRQRAIAEVALEIERRRL